MSKMVRLLINRIFDPYLVNIIVENTDSSLLIHRFSKLIAVELEKQIKNSWWD